MLVRGSRDRGYRGEVLDLGFRGVALGYWLVCMWKGWLSRSESYVGGLVCEGYWMLVVCGMFGLRVTLVV